MVIGVELDQHDEADERANDGEGQRLGRRHLAGGNGTARRARNLRVVVAVDVVVVGAARRAHHHRADREQHQEPQVRIGLLLRDLGEPHRPPARQQQEPHADRPVETGEPQVGPRVLGRVAVGPVVGRRIGNTGAALGWGFGGHVGHGCGIAGGRSVEPSGALAAAAIGVPRAIAVALRPLGLRGRMQTCQFHAPRLFVEAPLDGGARIACTPEQANYLLNVLRLGEGDEILVFNGRDGEWRARIVESGKRRCALLCAERARAQTRGARRQLPVCAAEARAPRLHGAEGDRDGRCAPAAGADAAHDRGAGERCSACAPT